MTYSHPLQTLFGFLLINMQLACAQKITTLPIDKVYAFSERRFVGNLPVDDNGNPTSPGSYIIYTLYIETKGTPLPEWNAAYKSDMTYSVATSEELAAIPLTVGKDKATNKPIVISPAKGSHLWKLELEQGQATTINNKRGDTLVLEGKYKGTPFVYRIKKVIELETLPRP